MIDDEATALLLRLGGLRAEVPADREARVRRAVLDECRAVARARRVRRRTIAVAIGLSAAAAAVVAVRVMWPREATPALNAVVATVEQLEGDGVRLVGRSGSTAPARIGLTATMHAGDQFETGATGRVGLRLSERVSLRFDHRSQARLISASAIELGAGAVYVDSVQESPNLEIHTPFGVVRDIGTQFEVRLGDSSLRIRVRSGIVEVVRGAERVSARPGTELTVDPAGTASRAVVPFGPEWAWAASLGPAFEIEGRSLAAFLEHVCREQGWTLSYAEPKLALESSGIILHGSTAGLPPSDALEIVMATTGLSHRLRNGELLVARIDRR